MQQAEHNTFYPFVLLDTIGEAVFVIDTQWRYTYVNKKAEELVGRPCEELLGNTIWELFPETVATIFSAEMPCRMRYGSTLLPHVHAAICSGRWKPSPT